MLRENFKRIRAEIGQAAEKVQRSPDEVTLVAVTKAASAGQVKEAFEQGIRVFGANRVQEEAPKIAQVPGARWHFIGHLQTNKVRHVLPVYEMVQTLDRLSLASEMQRRAEKLDLKLKVLLQVNISGEKSKFGLAPWELGDFLQEIKTFNCLEPLGLMTMAPFTADPGEARPYFKKLRLLRDEHARPDRMLPHLSMGMSGDYTVAVEEGATIVRIGGALFGSDR